MLKRKRLNREISALEKKELRDKKRAMKDEQNSVTRSPAPGGVVKVLLVQIVYNTSNIYLAQNQEGTIWGNTPSHPDQNGDHCLMRIYPEGEIDTRWKVQEVIPWGENLMDMLPKNTRWFIPV